MTLDDKYQQIDAAVKVSVANYLNKHEPAHLSTAELRIIAQHTADTETRMMPDCVWSNHWVRTWMSEYRRATIPTGWAIAETAN